MALPKAKIIDRVDPTLKEALKGGIKSKITFQDLDVVVKTLLKFKKRFPADYKRYACFPCIKIRT